MRLWGVLVLTGTVLVLTGTTMGASSATAALSIAAKLSSIIGALSGGLSPAGTSDAAAMLLRRFDAVTASLARLETEVRSVSLGPLRNLDAAIASHVRWGNTMQTLDTLLQNVHSKYDRFQFYQRNNGSIERYTLENFASEVVDHNSNSVQSTMYRLRDLVLSKNPRSSSGTAWPHRRYTARAGLFRNLQAVLKESGAMVCAFEQSPQQMAYSLLVIVLTTLGKMHAMVQFSYMLLHAMGKGKFTMEEACHSADYQNILDAVTLESVSAIRALPATFWRCDPARHERGVSYEEVSQLLQGYLENEVDLSSSGSCAGSCSDYDAVRTDRCYGAEDGGRLCGRQRRCRGTLHHCRFVASAATVCAATEQRRRYHWIQYGDGQTLGRSDGRCAGTTLQMSSWNRWFTQCSACFCLCDDDTHSERYFSLLPVVSHIADNYVVTGVRIVKKDGVFYIQLEQGAADMLGYAQPSSEQWKPIDRHIDINRDVEGVDFVRLSYERRGVLLQELRAPPGHAVTGVAFSTVLDYLSLKIRVTAISAAGELTGSSSRWLSCAAAAPVPSAGRLDLGREPSLPSASAASSRPDSRPGQTLTFEASSLSEDAAQTTLPLLDSQPVAPRPATWLTGVGLYHKGQPGGGGFIALSVVQIADNI